MKSNSETILSENNIELLVSYNYEETEGYYEEPTNITTYIPSSITNVYLTSVELVIGGTGVDVLQKLNYKQKEIIISKLNYE